MKKFKIPLSFLMLLTLCGVFYSCSQNQVKKTCSELSPDCELSKDFVMIKVIQNKGYALEAYGRALQEQKWYMYATKSGTIIDFDWSDNTKCVRPYDLDVLVSGKEPASILYHVRKFKIDTITNFDVHQNNPRQRVGTVEVVTKIVLLQTSGYFDIFRNNMNTQVTYVAP